MQFHVLFHSPMDIFFTICSWYYFAELDSSCLRETKLNSLRQILFSSLPRRFFVANPKPIWIDERPKQISGHPSTAQGAPMQTQKILYFQEFNTVKISNTNDKNRMKPRNFSIFCAYRPTIDGPILACFSEIWIYFHLACYGMKNQNCL